MGRGIPARSPSGPAVFGVTKTELVQSLRRVKLRLTAGGFAARALVPFVEVVEFWLSHGFREVIARSRMRLSGQTSIPRPHTLVLPAEEGLIQLTIPNGPGRSVVSIVIPVLNNAAMTHRSLRAIIEQTAPGSYEVIVVDNASDEDTRQMLGRVSGLRTIRNEKNAGFVGACNQGAAAAHGDFVLFLNNDTAVQPNWLPPLLGTFERFQSVGAVGSRLVYPTGRLQEAGGIIWSDGDGWNYGKHDSPDAPEFNYVREVDYCSGAALLLRRSVFDSLGGFDNRYAPAYYEDVDLAFRLRETGLRVLYQPASVVVHFEGATSGTDVATGFKSYQVSNRKKFQERHAEAIARQVRHDPELLRLARDRARGLRILVMDHMVPHHDQDAGSVRMMALLGIFLELGHRVTFLPDNLAPIQPYTSDMQQMGVEVLYGALNGPEWIRDHRTDFDIVVLSRARFAAQYVPALRQSPGGPAIVFDTVDLHFLREQRLAELEADPALARSAEKTRDLELGVMRQSDLVWVTSTHEADLLGQHADLPPIGVVPTIHSIRTGAPGFHSRKNIVFIGGFKHAPNEDAVHYFVSEIFPLVRRELHGVEFWVVGSHVPPSVLKLAAPDVVIKGFVPQVEPIFDACRLSVAPLRYGAGVKGKITQSLAYGLPAVATPVAAEGLELIGGEHLLVATDPGEFAQHVIHLYRDEATWTRIRTAGRDHIARHLGYEAMRDRVRSMLDQRRPRSKT